MPTFQTTEPVIVLAGRISWGEYWCKTHLTCVERKPVIYNSLEQLRGIRYKTIIILPDAVVPPELIHFLDRNTVIDLRDKE